MQHCWPFPNSMQQIKAAFASMSNIASNRTLGLMPNTSELKQLKDTSNLLDKPVLTSNNQSSALPNVAQLAQQSSPSLPLPASSLPQDAANLQATTNQQLTNSKETNGANPIKQMKLDPPLLLNNLANLNNLTNLTNLNSTLNSNCLNKSLCKKDEVEDINIEDDEPTIEDEEIDAVDDIGGDSGEDDSTTLKQKLKQQHQRALRRSAFSDPKSISSQLAKFQNHLNSDMMISALSQLVGTKQARTAAMALSNNSGPDSPPSGSLKSPNSTASATTLPGSGEDSPNSSFNSISIAGSKRRKYSTYSIAEILNEPGDVCRRSPLL